MAQILVIEDEPHMQELLRLTLESEGHTVEVAGDGDSGYQQAVDDQPDLVLLDVMLPGRSGWEVCKQLRTVSDVPVIMLTALGQVENEVRGLNDGADDYITKPFSPRQLLARIRACLRRSGTQDSSELSYGKLTIDPQRHLVSWKSEALQLTPKEFDLLLCLASNPHRVFSREQLLNTVWGYEYTGDTRTVNEHVHRLRSKLEEAGAGPFVETVWGVGYRFNPSLEDPK